MGVSIVLILVLISLMYNVVKKNRIGLNFSMCLIPIVLTLVSLVLTYYNTANKNIDMAIYITNLISCTFGLILILIAILMLIKDRKNVKTSKAVLLIAMVLTYICTMFLSIPKYEMFLSKSYMRMLYMICITVGLLSTLQVNLFVNLISNNKKEENHGK